tara:strand:- start:1677 stop:1880 length:204 start_codon:yes stop_codon:yes gene_type:complete
MKSIINLYLDWVNNYLSLEVFAEHNQISIKLASLIIKEGRILHEINTAGIDSLNTPAKTYFINKMEH